MRRYTALSITLTLCVPVFVGAQGNGAAKCDPDNAGLKLPAGFCATVFADSVQGARHIAVAANGDVFIARSGASGGILALRDADKDGHAEMRQVAASGFR